MCALPQHSIDYPRPSSKYSLPSPTIPSNTAPQETFLPYNQHAPPMEYLTDSPYHHYLSTSWVSLPQPSFAYSTSNTGASASYSQSDYQVAPHEHMVHYEPSPTGPQEPSTSALPHASTFNARPTHMGSAETHHSYVSRPLQPQTAYGSSHASLQPQAIYAPRPGYAPPTYIQGQSFRSQHLTYQPTH